MKAMKEEERRVKKLEKNAEDFERCGKCNRELI